MHGSNGWSDKRADPIASVEGVFWLRKAQEEGAANPAQPLFPAAGRGAGLCLPHHGVWMKMGMGARLPL